MVEGVLVNLLNSLSVNFKRGEKYVKSCNIWQYWSFGEFG